MVREWEYFFAWTSEVGAFFGLLERLEVQNKTAFAAFTICAAYVRYLMLF